MYEPTKGRLYTYSAMFSPKPLVGVRFANPDIVRDFEMEMDARWNGVQEYLDAFAQRSAYSDSNEIVEGMDIWKHSEGGVVEPVGNSLPPKSYGLVGIYDAVRVISETRCGIEREFEVIFSVKEYAKATEDVKSIMESGLPSGIFVSRALRLYSVDMENGFSIRVRAAEF